MLISGAIVGNTYLFTAYGTDPIHKTTGVFGSLPSLNERGLIRQQNP
jgi:hypothetical protein